MKNRPEFVVLLRELENRLQKSNAELKKCPAGVLRKSVSNGTPVFFQAYTDDDNKIIRRSLYRKPETARALARKVYLEEETRILERNVILLKRWLQDCHLLTPDEIIGSLPKR